VKINLFLGTHDLGGLGVFIQISAVIVISVVPGLGQSSTHLLDVTVVQQAAYRDPRCFGGDDTQTYERSVGLCYRGDSSTPELIQPRCCLFLPGATIATPVQDFVYQITIRNNGAKTIRSVHWNYLFIDPDTREEIAVHRFATEEKIPAGKRKTIAEHSPSPPTRIISVKALLERRSNPFIERVVITRVSYTDGSVWQSGATSP
jgi:hypothetical protein